MLDRDDLIKNASHPVCPCILLLDTSGSMDGMPISALNEGLRVFQQDIQKDSLARLRIEVAIITFGEGGVKTVQSFTKVAKFEAPVLSAGGSTPMGEAINKALDMLREHMNQLRYSKIKLYRPWIFLITDGSPTDQWQAAAERVHREDQANNSKVAFFAVGVGEADMSVLSKIAVREPLKLEGLKFNELFLWLSASQKRVSSSTVGETVQLPAPQGWAAV